ncbi:MAG: hypothetical protein AAFS10_06975 [Myxococcota bacterium]
MANTTLQDLRNLLYDPPSSHLWKRLIGLVEGEPDDDLRTIAAQYVTPFLNDGWPDHLRLAPRPWWEAQTRGREVLCWPWVRGLTSPPMPTRQPKAPLPTHSWTS